jgi:branched-chain amino acid transport system ATP-binding protein
MSAHGNVALVLVEQHAAVALGLTREAVIMERGRIAHRDVSASLLADGDGLDRYLGLKLGAG